MTPPLNPFESGSRRVVPAVLVYAERDGKLLMLHRNAKATPGRPKDFHQGKWNGLGGKCELDESFQETAIRELREESGIALPASAFRALGTLQFPNFKPQKREDWLVAVFSVSVPPGVEPWKECAEGELSWIEGSRVLELNLWAGDRYFVPHILAKRPFMGTIWYEGELVNRVWIEPLHP